jgi:hypothetical protein
MNARWRAALVLAAPLALYSAAAAAAAPAPDSVQLWTGVFVGAQTPKVRFDVDVQSRFREDGVSHTFLIRPIVAWRPTPTTQLGAGYAYIAPSPFEALSEQRAVAQALWTPTFEDGRVSVVLRARGEVRFRDDDPGFRGRLLARALVRPFAERGAGLLVWDEFFVAPSKTTYQPKFFDQNRVFVGATGDVGKHWRLEGGYLLQALVREPTWTLNHAFALFLVANY